MKFLAALAIGAAALVLTATASTAGAARGVAHQRLALLRHAAHASRLAPASRTTKATPFNCVTDCSLYESTINQYFTDVAAASASNATDNVYSVATQYSSIQYDVTFDAATNSYVDGNPFPTTKTCNDAFEGAHDTYCVTDTQLKAEIAKVIAKKHWPTFSKTTLYFIFTPANVGVCISAGAAGGLNACTTNVFCAYHSSASTGFLYAVEPDADAVAGGFCDSGQAPAGNGADSTINTVSHEHNEAITDPFGDAWYSNDAEHGNPENGDLCAYDFGTALGTTLGGEDYNQVINGHDYYLQLEYSNAANSNAGGCVPYLGGPVTANDTTQYGSGPLVLQTVDADVMTTNTVYAIYWVPAAPVNSRLPRISGIAKVGKKLRVLNGAWSNEPKFTYRWLRCSSAGTSCKGITKATRSSYILVKADKGHRLEVRVTGTNMVGSVSATSAPTGVVKS